MLADNLASLLNQSVDLGTKDEKTDVTCSLTRATAAKTLARCVHALLLHVQTITSLTHHWAAIMGRSLI